MAKLLIVESPTKAKTIKKYLGKDFPVVSSKGHVRDLPKSKISVDVDKDFEPEYQTIRGKASVIKEIKREAKKHDGVIMATDPDREGEAIAWHLAFALGLKEDEVERIAFHEITKTAIEKALKKPGKIDMDKVDAQQARRILDRLVGYNLSPFLWKKIRYGLSAGRVQSVAVRLVVERERERDAFDSRVYWKISAVVGRDKPEELQRVAVTEEQKQDAISKARKAKSDETEGGTNTPWGIFRKSSQDDDLWQFALLGDDNKPEHQNDEKWIQNRLENLPETIKIESVIGKDGVQSPPPPFVTSTLQRTAFSRYGFSGKRTMMVAQKLYEAGLITYMRTDSVRISDTAIKGIHAWIGKNLGAKYLLDEPRRYKTKSKAAQEAHEAIRPTDFKKNELSGRFGVDTKKIYKLIYNRAVATQCAQAKVKRWTLKATAASKDKKGNEVVDKLVAKNTELKFDGFYRVTGIPKELQKKKKFVPKEGEDMNVHVWAGVEGHTPPPPRYTEASLIKELEKNGIGRPSTYASIIDTILNRTYVTREGRALAPTDNGFVVCDLLVKHFPKIVDVEFTAGMEEELDEIAKGKEKWREVVREFYDPFIKNLTKKEKEVKKEDVVLFGDSEEKCPECGGGMVIRLGRFGKFQSCKKFPECKGMKPFDEEDLGDEFWEKYEEIKVCEKCGGPMTMKAGRFGKFWACEKYPKCKSTKPLLLKEKCPECDSNLVERKARRGNTFIGCSGYPDCKYIKKEKKK